MCTVDKSLKPVVIHNPSRIYEGYTVINPVCEKDVWLVDIQGRFVHRWRVPHALRNMGIILPQGNLLCGDKIPEGKSSALPGSAERLLEIDWNSSKIWEYKDVYLNSHEWCRMKNGNTVISHWVPIPKDLTSKIKGGKPGSERDGIIWGDVLQEVTPEGKVVWECPVYELLDPDRDVICPLCPRETWTYVNSLVVLPDGNILVSFRLINTIAIIDREKCTIKWRWGPGEIAHQHNPTLLDNGNILVFDNGLHREASANGIGSFSRVVEVNPNTNKIEWEYRDRNVSKFYSPIGSGAQRLPNGNTLICEATKGRVFEVTPEKEIVWEFFNPFYRDYPRGGVGWSNLIYRAQRYAYDYPGLEGKSLNPRKFEWVLWEKNGPETRKTRSVTEEAVRARLRTLGY